jgi:hypothetical protein
VVTLSQFLLVQQSRTMERKQDLVEQELLIGKQDQLKQAHLQLQMARVIFVILLVDHLQ